MPDTPDDEKDKTSEKAGGRVITAKALARYKATLAALPIVAGSSVHIQQSISDFFDDATIKDTRKRMAFNVLVSFARASNLSSFAELTNTHVVNWRATIPSTNSQKTYVASLRMMCGRFVKLGEEGWLSENPVAEMPAGIPLDLSVPAIVERLDGAKGTINRYIRQTYPKLFEDKAGRVKGIRIPVRHLTALRHFCKFLEEKNIPSLTAISEQDIARYIAEKKVSMPSITMLRQVFEQLLADNVLPENLFFYHAQKTSTKIERSANLLTLLAGDGFDGLTTLNAFIAQPHVAKYRSLYVNSIEDFAIYALEIAGVKSLRDISPDIMVAYRDSILLQRFTYGTAITYFTHIKQFINFVDEHVAGAEGIPAASYTRRKRSEDVENRTDLLEAFRAAQDKISQRRAREALRRDIGAAPQATAPIRPHAQNLDLTKDLDYGQRHMLAGLVDFLMRNDVRLTAENRAVNATKNKGLQIGGSYIVAARRMGFIVTEDGVERYTDAFVARFKELKTFSQTFLAEHRAAMKARFGNSGSTP